MKAASASILAVLLALPGGAGASDTNYQDFLLGQRAMGMGGAFTSLADDPSAAWYNPGGLALLERSSASASVGLYGIESRSIEQGFANPVKSVDLSSLSFPIFQTTLSVMTKFGGNDAKKIPSRNAIGFSLLLPFNKSLGFRQFVAGARDPGTGQLQEAAVYELRESDRTLRVGPSYARSFGKDFAIGFSLFYDYRTYSRASEITGFQVVGPFQSPCEGTPTACSIATNVDNNTGSLFVRLGALWKIDKRWRLGVAFSTPNLVLHGGVGMFSRRLVASPEPGGVQLAAESREDQGTSSKRPFELRVGASYTESKRFTLSADVTIHGPAAFSRIDTPGCTNGGGLQPGCPILDPTFVRIVRREPVVNLNVGAELFPTAKMPIRLGFYTNFSSAPEIPHQTPDAYLTRVHMYGATASIGYLGDGYGIDFGVSVSFGSGVTQTIDPDTPTLVLRRAGVSNRLIYFFVSGIGRALARNVRRLLDRFQKL